MYLCSIYLARMSIHDVFVTYISPACPSTMFLLRISRSHDNQLCFFVRISRSYVNPLCFSYVFLARMTINYVFFVRISRSHGNQLCFFVRISRMAINYVFNPKLVAVNSLFELIH